MPASVPTLIALPASVDVSFSLKATYNYIGAAVGYIVTILILF